MKNTPILIRHISELTKTLSEICNGSFDKRPKSYGHTAVDGLVDSINILLDRLEHSEARDRTILEGMEDGYFELDIYARITSCNPVFCRMLGYAATVLKGRTFSTLQPHQQAHLTTAPSVTETEVGAPASTWLNRADGSVGYFEAHLSRISDSRGGIVGYRGILHDVSKHVHHQKNLYEMVYRDALTGLGNRKAFYRDLEIAIKNGSSPLTLAFIDLDHFKQVNDTFGHDAGDAILECSADRLRNVLRSTDNAYRLGGDEFTLICQHTEDTEAIQLSKRLLDAFSAPFAIDGTLIDFVTVSIGLAIAPNHAKTAATLLKCADEAMYEAKKKRGTFYVYASN
ncbi:diguanylate cyclase domain-containing protein [Pseudomonas sp. NPDC089408]|uniref:diguanylate cyclase domain-containing protein n=1 Tax=Pseudomonas sp. NPDC089408 TaxID=3364465 RepID=UPI00382FCB43